MAALTTLIGGGNKIRKIHTFELSNSFSGSPGEEFTEDFDITSYGIQDYEKCLIYTKSSFLTSRGKLTSNTNYNSVYGSVSLTTDVFQVIEFQ
jgi:hypothetical protein